MSGAGSVWFLFLLFSLPLLGILHSFYTGFRLFSGYPSPLSPFSGSCPPWAFLFVVLLVSFWWSERMDLGMRLGGSGGEFCKYPHVVYNV